MLLQTIEALMRVGQASLDVLWWTRRRLRTMFADVFGIVVSTTVMFMRISSQESI